MAIAKISGKYKKEREQRTIRATQRSSFSPSSSSLLSYFLPLSHVCAPKHPMNFDYNNPITFTLGEKEALRTACMKLYPIQFRKNSLMFRIPCLPEEVCSQIHALRDLQDHWIDSEEVEHILGFSPKLHSLDRDKKDLMLLALLSPLYHRWKGIGDEQWWYEFRHEYPNDRHLCFAYLWTIQHQYPYLRATSVSPIVTDYALAQDLVTFSFTAVVFFDMPTFQKDEKLFMMAFRQNPVIYRNLPTHLKCDKTIIIDVLRRRSVVDQAQLGSVYRSLDVDLRSDEDIIKAALESRAGDYHHVPVRLVEFIS